MKVYKFYLKPDASRLQGNVFGREMSLEEKYPLYAVCPDKKSYKGFKNSRNMDLFIVKINDVDDEEGDDFIIRHRNKLISLVLLETITNRYTDHQREKYAPVFMTEDEINYLTELTDGGNIIGALMGINSPAIPTDIFKSKISESLRYLKYDQAVSLGVENPYMGSYGVDNLDCIFDQLNSFCLLFHHQLSKDFYDILSIQDTRNKPS